MMVASLFIVVPFLGLLFLNLPFKKIMMKLSFWVLCAFTLVQTTLAIIWAPNAWNQRIALFDSILKFDLAVDNLTRVMLFCIGLVVLTTLLVGRQLIRDEKRHYNFVNLLLVTLAGMNGTVLVKDIFSLYVFLEITAVASFILIAFHDDVLSFEGAFKYIIISAVASTFLLTAIALLIFLSGDTDFSVISAALKISAHPYLIMLTAGIFICGLFIKAGLMPFHGWLPDAYQTAPAPVSVLLAGIVTKVVGVYTLIRIMHMIFGLNGPLGSILMFVGSLSIVAGALAALGQNDFKRMLAYSSISQVGYIILGLGSGTALGVAGAVFHLFNHTIFKSLLFVNAASIELQTGSRDMNKMSGLAQRMPLTGFSSVIGSLSAAGIPPLAGFWSKLIIILALWLAGQYTYAIIAVLASVITLGYFLMMQRQVFFGLITSEWLQVKEINFGLILPTLILTMIIIAVGVFFPWILRDFILPAGPMFGG